MAKLKRAGIISPSIDARSVKPTKRYFELFKDYVGVIGGRQKTVKLTKKQIRHASESGLRTVRDRVIVDKTPGSRVVKVKSDPFGFRIDFPDGIRKVQVGKPRGETVEDFIDRLKKEYPGDVKGSLTFTFFGGQSKSTFHTFRHALEYFAKYERINNGHTADDQRDIIQAVEFYLTRKRSVELVPGGPKLPRTNQPKKKSKKPARKR